VQPKSRHEELREGQEWLAERRGIDVAYYPFRSPRIAGLLIHEDDGGYCIGINSRMILTRQLFSLAHELGRCALHRHVQAMFLCHVGRQDRPEREANTYAVQLLMPEHAVRELQARGKGLRDLCTYFGVSRAAMEWRLEEPGLR